MRIKAQSNYGEMVFVITCCWPRSHVIQNQPGPDGFGIEI